MNNDLTALLTKIQNDFCEVSNYVQKLEAENTMLRKKIEEQQSVMVSENSLISITEAFESAHGLNTSAKKNITRAKKVCLECFTYLSELENISFSYLNALTKYGALGPATFAVIVIVAKHYGINIKSEHDENSNPALKSYIQRFSDTIIFQ